MREQVSRWVLDNFSETFDVWVASEGPPVELRSAVLAWVFGRAEDPYAGVRRESGFANLWFGATPRTLRMDTVVACSYWVEERRHVVRCDSMATLSLPL